MMDHENCRHLLSSLSEFVDGSLDEQLCIEIERHLAECENCRVVIDSLKKTVYLYQISARETADMPVDVRQRLFHRLNLDEFIKRH